MWVMEDLDLFRSQFSFSLPSIEPDNKFLATDDISEGHLLLLFTCQKIDTHFLMVCSIVQSFSVFKNVCIVACFEIIWFHFFRY